MSILDKLLEIEEKEELYRYTFSYKNIMMYPFIRFFLLQSAIEDMLEIPGTYDVLHIGIIQKIKYIIKSFLYRPKSNIQSDIIFFGTDISNINHDGVYYNRLTESFANEYPSKTILIEVSDKMDYKRPRTYPKVFTKDFVNIIATIKARLKSMNSKDLKQIEYFIKYLKNNFNHNFTDTIIWDRIESILIHSSRYVSFLCEGYRKLINKLSPKIIFLEDACYGGEHVCLIMTAKDLKIPIGEYQHGLISLTHPAYSYSACLHDSYKYYMPNFYMCWGKYWMENSRIPVKILMVGNPYLSDTLSQQVQGKKFKKKQLLYVSSALNPECYVREVILLNKYLSDKDIFVIFRIHPSETLRLQTVYKPIIDAGISVDTQPLYETLKETKYLFGDYSTVLFEATMFDCVIFVRDSILNREHFDISQLNIVHNIKEIVEKINLKNYKKTNSDNFWVDNWRVKYHQIIDSYIL